MMKLRIQVMYMSVNIIYIYFARNTWHNSY